MSDTPRTDVATQEMVRFTPYECVPADFARKLERELHEATLGRCTCSLCGKTVNNAWRDQDGYSCLTCLAKQRNAISDALVNLLDNSVVINQPGDAFVDLQIVKEHYDAAYKAVEHRLGNDL